jgi:hypothetical protein
MGPFLAACETNVRTGAAEVKIREPILETGASVGKQLVEGDGAVRRHRQRRLAVDRVRQAVQRIAVD